MSETYAKRTVREERTQDTYTPYLRDGDKSLLEKNRKGNLSAFQSQTFSLLCCKIG